MPKVKRTGARLNRGQPITTAEGTKLAHRMTDYGTVTETLPEMEIVVIQSPNGITVRDLKRHLANLYCVYDLKIQGNRLVVILDDEYFIFAESRDLVLERLQHFGSPTP